MRRTNWLAGPIAACVAVASAACTTEPSPAGPTTPVPVSSSPPAGVELACGIDPEDLERLVGHAVDRWEDDIVVRDGAGTGECTVFNDDYHERNGFFTVTLYPLNTSEAQDTRATVDGLRALNPFDVIFDRRLADGGVWGAVERPNERPHSSVVSRVFWGDTMINLTAGRITPWRTGSDEMLALTFQVAQSYGLERPERFE
jgi:hypothetical protein